MTWMEVAGDIDASETERRLGEILQALHAIVSAKGVLSDLRVTPTGTVAVSASIAANQDIRNITGALATLTNANNLGGLSLSATIPQWTNQTAVQSFVNNITRS